ncbi:helix-turn-helix transcriptional regulator [Chitinophaga sp. Cy-1792]|uniref:AraC family transcriptional regulator n=1 Tax=Chitinophaga sp. Cy-1792 TaxID=2608339 RepID=UPI0014207A57|nr:helix-turn-helix transcriptional regulator [Chitinophaga sp. Cy-1792]
MKSIKIFQHTCTPQKKHQLSIRTIKELLGHVPEKLYRPHRVNFYVMHLYTKGSGTHQVDFKNVEVKPGRMVFISKGQVHSFDHHADYDGYALMFTEDFFGRTDFYRQFLDKSTLYNDPLAPSYIDTGDRFNELCCQFDYMIAEQKRHEGEIQELLLHNYLTNVLLISEIKHGRRGSTILAPGNNDLVTRFKNLVNEHLLEQWPIKYYAQELNVTQRTLENAFVKGEHTTPKKWLMERLILEIKRRLCYEGDIPIKSLADLLGFKEVSNFVKFFKNETGVTPVEFRKRLKIPEKH